MSLSEWAVETIILIMVVILSRHFGYKAGYEASHAEHSEVEMRLTQELNVEDWCAWYQEQKEIDNE